MPTITYSRRGRLELYREGATIAVEFSIPDELAASLRKQGKAVPQPVARIALIDTGATVTVIDAGVARQLRLNPVDVGEVETAGGTEEWLRYDFKVQLPAGLPAIAVYGVASPRENTILIGRDILSYGTLTYRGSDGSFTLDLSPRSA